MATFGSMAISSEFVHIKIGGDLALIKGMMKVIFERQAMGEKILDEAFIAEHTVGIDAIREEVMSHDWKDLVRVSGISEEQIRKCAEIYIQSRATVICYGMGITQHQEGSRLVQQIANLLFLKGNFAGQARAYRQSADTPMFKAIALWASMRSLRRCISTACAMRSGSSLPGSTATTRWKPSRR